MKHFILRYTIIFVLLFGMVLLFNSCEPDDTNPDGIEDARLKFTGTWMCTEQSQLSYPVTIAYNPQNTSEVFIKNFNFFGNNEHVIASIAGFSMNIPQQDACSGTYVVKGSGLMTSNKKDIVLQYTVTDGANMDTINANYTKQ